MEYRSAFKDSEIQDGILFDLVSGTLRAFIRCGQPLSNATFAAVDEVETFLANHPSWIDVTDQFVAGLIKEMDDVLQCQSENGYFWAGEAKNISGIQYPIGRFDFNDPFHPGDRARFLQQLADAPANLRAAVASLSDEQLDTPYRPNGWTVRQLVNHLADASINWYIRVKLAATEDLPTTSPYSEQLWAELPDARTGSIEPSLRIFEGITTRWCRFLGSLQPSDWEREFLTSELGTRSIEEILRSEAWHARHHTAQITELRQRMGW
jgi:uncharacterized damage-inducible protein DinB